MVNKLSKVGKAHIGHKHSDKTKTKLSKLRSGTGNSNYGKSPSETTKQKISDSMKRYYQLRGRKVVETHEEIKKTGTEPTGTQEDVNSGKRDFEKSE